MGRHPFIIIEQLVLASPVLAFLKPSWLWSILLDYLRFWHTVWSPSPTNQFPFRIPGTSWFSFRTEWCLFPDAYGGVIEIVEPEQHKAAQNPDCNVEPYNAPPIDQDFPPFDPNLASIYRYRQQQGVNLGSW
jgi:hypothetical protein